MKRLITILLSVLVLLIAVQPVLAFHFCSGRLASIEVLSQGASGCCPETSSDTNKQVIGSDCCHTSVVELSTDDYLQQDSNQQIVPFSVLAFVYVRTLIADFTFDSVLSSKREAPPVYLFTEGRDLLTRFCVYII